MENEINTAPVLSRKLSFMEKTLSLLLRGIPIKHGRHRILDAICPKVWDGSGSNVAFSFNGCEIVFDPYDLVGWHFVMLKSFDPEVIEVLEKACDPRSQEVLWDIGANKGACFCSLAAKLPLLQVVAIEPQSKLLASNILNLNSLCPDRYEYVGAGVGEEEAKLALTIPNSNLGRASLHLKQTSSGDEVEVIQIYTASQIVRNSKYGWPTVIKVDVEGHEPQVFKSLQPCIESKACKVIVFENHTSEAEAFETIKEITEPYGYQIFGISKSPWSTALLPARKQKPGITDYAVVRSDLVKENKRFAGLIR